MHFEILVEDTSGKRLIECVIDSILNPPGQSGVTHEHTYRILSYKGVGHIPKDLRGSTDPAKRVLLDRLPKVLAGYGRSLPAGQTAVVVVVDSDNKDCRAFKQELLGILQGINPRPVSLFRIAIEEMESWLLGDRSAVVAAFPDARQEVLRRYVQDSICGTWEMLADAVHPGGSMKLKKQGYPPVGSAKCAWAETIGPHMDVESNCSPSFQAFRDGLRRLARGD